MAAISLHYALNNSHLQDNLVNAAAGVDTCNGFDYLIPLVMAAVSRLEGNLEGGMIGGFEPRLQERDQILIHVFLEGLTCSTDLQHSREQMYQCKLVKYTGPHLQTAYIYVYVCCLTGSILRMLRDLFFLVA